jgi:hypothetical protein
MYVAEDVQRGPYAHHGVQQLATSCVQTGRGCRIEDAERRTMGDQDVNVIPSGR